MLLVDASPLLLDKAHRRWGRAERPNYDDFCEGPLAAAEFFCERGYDELPPESPGSPIKLIALPPTGLFPIVVFFAMEIVTGEPSRRLVELLDYSLHDSLHDRP